MSLPISSVAKVTITRETVAQSQAAFGIPLIVTETTNFAGRTSRIYKAADLLDLGFAATDAVYLKAQAIFSQELIVEYIEIGRKDAGESWTVALSAIQDANPSWYWLICTTEVTADIKLISAWVEGLTADKMYAYQSQDAGALVSPVDYLVLSSMTNGFDGATYAKSTTTGYKDESDNLVADSTYSIWAMTDGASGYHVVVANFDNDPKFVDWSVYNSTTHPDTWSVGALTLTNEETLATASDLVLGVNRPDEDDANVDYNISQSVFQDIADLNYDRSVGSYTDNGHLDAGIVGVVAPYPPGSITAKFKTVKGVVAAGLTDSQAATLRGQNANFFATFGGVDMYSEGVVASGEFIDVMNGIDWIEYNVSFKVFSALQSAKKIPYTDAGAAVIESETKAVLQQAVERSILAADPAPTVSVPLVANISAVDKAARLLPDVTFDGTLAGAIHKTTISGAISV